MEGNGFRLGCRYCRVHDDAPTIIHYHGNGETVADYIGEFEERITGLGANLLLAEYRGYGMSGGAPALAAMLEDVELIVAASGIPAERIVFFGRSLGSLYALHGAARYPRAAGLIVESGLADPLERILVRIEPCEVGATAEDLRASVQRCLDQREKITAFTGRVLVMHTRNDDLVPVSHAERLHAWAGQRHSSCWSSSGATTTASCPPIRSTISLQWGRSCNRSGRVPHMAMTVEIKGISFHPLQT